MEKKYLYIDKSGRGDIYELSDLDFNEDDGDWGDYADIMEWDPEVGEELELRTFKLIRVQ